MRNMKVKYKWKRFWCPHTGQIHLGDNGFMSDPENDSLKLFNPDIVSYEMIANMPCLALLGEPGIGKSTAIEDICRSQSNTNSKIMNFNLNRYCESSLLIDDIFRSEYFISWLNNDHTLDLFLDSLDECRIHIPTVANIICDELNAIQSHLSRLRLRIVCRSADWPTVFNNRLPLIWNNTNNSVDTNRYAIYELTPLRRKDVREAAETNNINPDLFLKGIEEIEVVPFAIKPLTLNFLINLYQNHNKFPSTKKELFEEGCKILCEEYNPSWIDLSNSLNSKTSLYKKREIASKIAAISLLCNKSEFYDGPAKQLKNNQLSVLDLISVVNCSRSEINDTLQTGLFSLRGNDLLGFVHQGYAEYLASKHIVDSKIKLKLIENLLCIQFDSEIKVIPQLTEVAAWIASYRKDAFHYIATHDPQVLLKGDICHYSIAELECLAQGIIDLLACGKINVFGWQNYVDYKKINHPGLSNQLKPYIENQQLDIYVRESLIHIACISRTIGLQQTILDIALNHQEAIRLRIAAAAYICEVAEDNIKIKMKPLLFLNTNTDDEESLKGYACESLWPNLIEAEELFKYLDLPRKRYSYSAYTSFLENLLVENLETNDLPRAIKWLQNHIEKRFPDRLNRTKDSLVLKAFGNIDNEYVITSLAHLCITLLIIRESLIESKEVYESNKAIFENRVNSRILVKRIVELCDIDSIFQVAGQMVYGMPNLIAIEDIPWLIQNYRESTNLPLSQKWGKVLQQLLFQYDRKNISYNNMIIEAVNESSELCDTLGLMPIDLNSEKARQYREDFIENKKWQEKQNKNIASQTLDWLPADRVKHWLNAIENGDYKKWHELCFDLTLEDTDENYDAAKWSLLNISELPGWTKADCLTKKRIIKSAKQFLIKEFPDAMKWINEPNQWHITDISSNKAFATLLINAPEILDDLNIDIWEKWVPYLIGISFSDKELDIKKKLLSMAYHKCPKTLLRNVELLIEVDFNHARHNDVCDKLDGCWDNNMCETVLQSISRLKFTSKQSSSICHILSLLLVQKYQPAIDYVKALAVLQSEEESDKIKKIAASIALMTGEVNGAWNILWHEINRDNNFGQELFLEYACVSGNGNTNISHLLNETEIANLYIWMVKQFPSSENPRLNESHFVGRRDSIVEFRDNLLSYLKNIGSVEACKAIEIIKLEFPEYLWLNRTLVIAKENTRRNIWEPLTIHEFYQMMSSPDIRNIRCESELLDIILESLEKLEQKLQGETPAAIDLWNHMDQKKYRPKDENTFSDYIKRHLDDDLKKRIITTREPQIRKGRGNRPGENLDITVELPATDNRPSLKVIIECKGCWHTDIYNAMKNQLVDRYLKDNSCQYGLYLVGWYGCSICYNQTCRNKNNIKKTKPCQKGAINDLKAGLEKQANDLSKNGLYIKMFVLNVALR